MRSFTVGKSSEEIALIRGLSSHPVNTYLRSAMGRLDVVNQIQAVAATCCLRLI
ncbi:LuxR C-terminal-related transcriptional regulator [Rhizobium sp. 3T7]|nr:LuxR C-terminal-related transcriptional regulator [Rhizobium sp. 3T7]